MLFLGVGYVCIHAWGKWESIYASPVCGFSHPFTPRGFMVRIVSVWGFCVGVAFYISVWFNGYG